MRIECVISTADFEENTLTLTMPVGFWNNHTICCGTAKIETDSIAESENDNGN